MPIDVVDRTTERPRWACELSDEAWDGIHDMLDAGHQTMDIVRELQIPESKVRSLQEYVRRQGPRRRLNQWAQFKDALLGDVPDLGPKLTRALAVTAELAVSNETDAKTQVRAIEAMTKYVGMVSDMAAVDAKTESEREQDERLQGKKQTPAEALTEVLEGYDKTVDGS